MKLVCVQPFGHRSPGDEVEVPDDCGFDPFYFARKAPAKAAPAPTVKEK